METQKLIEMPQMAINLAILSRLEDISNRLEQKVAYLRVEDAVNNYYKQHLTRLKAKTRKNYDTILMRFQDEFQERNLADRADISADDIAQFIDKYWPIEKCKPNTRVNAFVSIKAFIAWNRRFQIRKGLPDFTNPCDALIGEYIKSHPKSIAFDDDTIAMMKRLIASAETDRMKATFITLCTSGMRANEICNTRKSDINGQIVLLKDHKGIRWNTPDPKPAIAVIPKIVADMIKNMNTGRPFISYRSLYDAFQVRIRNGILPEGIIRHDFRKYVATFFARKGEEAMKQFILRHRSDKSADKDPMSQIYIAPLTPEQAIEKMKILEAELGLKRFAA